MQYKLIYERNDGFAGSETGIPAAADKQFDITRAELESFRLVYSKNGEVYYSETGIPADTDKKVADYKATETSNEGTEAASELDAPANSNETDPEETGTDDTSTVEPESEEPAGETTEVDPEEE